MDIFLRANGVQIGPFSETNVREKLQSGEIGLNDLALVEGTTSWEPVSTIINLTKPPPLTGFREDSTSSIPRSIWESDLFGWKGGGYIYVFCGGLCFLAIPFGIAGVRYVSSEMGDVSIFGVIGSFFLFGMVAFLIYGGVLLIKKGLVRIKNPEPPAPDASALAAAKRTKEQHMLIWQAITCLIILWNVWKNYKPSKTISRPSIFAEGTDSNPADSPTPFPLKQATYDDLVSPESLYGPSKGLDDIRSRHIRSDETTKP